MAGHDGHPGLVHRRAGQVVHRRVDDAEVFPFIAGSAGLEHQHLGQQHAGIADQRAAGLQQQLTVAVATRGDAGQQLAHQHVGGRRLLVGVGDAQAAAQVDVVDRDAVGLDLLDQVEQAVQRVEVGRDLGDLRADVAVDADHPDAGQCGGAAVEGQGSAVRNAELVALQAGGDVGVGLGVDVGVHAQADRGGQAQADGHLGQPIQLIFALDVEAFHTGLQRAAHLGAGLADAGEHHLGWVAADGDHAGQFTTRDDVETQPLVGEGLDHREVRIGLHRVTQQVWPTDQGPLVGGGGGLHCAA